MSVFESNQHQVVGINEAGPRNCQPKQHGRSASPDRGAGLVTHSMKLSRNDRGESDKHELVPYQDFSTVTDPDPLTPLTPAGRLPSFPAKMHAILSRKDLSEIISWMPHGRSWRVQNPDEFEKRIMPTYFGLKKFTSFLRQANGWGFRRITRGRDADSYCHPLFLRGLPHLCKTMKRAGAEKSRPARMALDDVDLYKMSQLHPVPESYSDDSVLLPCILKDGPNARVPVRIDWKSNEPKFSDYEVKTDKASFIESPQCPNDVNTFIGLSTIDAGYESPKKKPSSNTALLDMSTTSSKFQKELIAQDEFLVTTLNHSLKPAVIVDALQLLSHEIENSLKYATKLQEKKASLSYFAAGFAAATAMKTTQGYHDPSMKTWKL